GCELCQGQAVQEMPDASQAEPVTGHDLNSTCRDQPSRGTKKAADHLVWNETNGPASARDAESAKCNPNQCGCEWQGYQGRRQQPIAGALGNQPTGKRGNQRSRHRAC